MQLYDRILLYPIDREKIQDSVETKKNVFLGKPFINDTTTDLQTNNYSMVYVLMVV
jgi:hypothetical protein